MKPTADLQAALSFVTSRIEEAAFKSGDPLSEEQRYLLHHLPTSSPFPYGPSVDSLVPRDFDFERLCEATKSAHADDLRLNPTSATEWEFTAAVAKLNRHPMSWLLEWSGVHVRRPWWDKWLLIPFAFLFVLLMCSVMVLAEVAGPRTTLQWLGIGIAFIAVLTAGYFASRRIEESQLIRKIETCRRTSNYPKKQNR